MKKVFSNFDASDYLKTEEDISAYLEAAMEDGDPQVLVSAMGDIVKARNVTQVARDTGLTREGIYKAFSREGNPSFATVWKVAGALDIHLFFRSGAAKPVLVESKSRAGIDKRLNSKTSIKSRKFAAKRKSAGRALQVSIQPRNDGRWAVQTDGTQRAGSLHDKKADAIRRGRELAENKSTELVVRDESGKIVSSIANPRELRRVRG